MTEENLNYSINDLERVKYTSDSDTNNSIVQTFEMNQTVDDIRHREIISSLSKVCEELIKINLYLSIMTEEET